MFGTMDRAEVMRTLRPPFQMELGGIATGEHITDKSHEPSGDF